MSCNACTQYVICDECSRLACRGNSCEKEISMDELVKLLKKIGTFDTCYPDLKNKTYCCVNVDNFTKDTLKFVGSEEGRGFFIHKSDDKDVSPGYSYSFVTRKAGMSWYGPAVACAWQVQDYLIAASWQVPVANSGYCNNICIGITHPGIKYYQITQNSLETILGNEKSEKRAQHAINYYEGGKKSGFFSTIQKLVIDNNIEDQTIKNQYIKVKVKMTKGPICSLSIQVFPMSVNNYAPELINYVVEQKRHICIYY
jgi:hypothetical protein